MPACLLPLQQYLQFPAQHFWAPAQQERKGLHQKACTDPQVSCINPLGSPAIPQGMPTVLSGVLRSSWMHLSDLQGDAADAQGPPAVLPAKLTLHFSPQHLPGPSLGIHPMIYPMVYPMIHPKDRL